MVTCADAIEEAVKHYNEIVTNSQVIDYLNTKFPEKPWQLTTIRAHLIGCTVNHSSSHHYKNFRKFLFSVDSGRVRLYNPESDGIWIWTPNGMKGKDEPSGDIETEDLEFNNDEITLSMEKDLETFLLNDISSLDSSLTLISKIENRQITVPSGRIDILAKDKDGIDVVIELKAGEAKDSSLTQLLAYMNDIISKSGSGKVRGILVAHEFSDKLIKASKLVPSILLKRYNVSFSFEPVLDEM
jgi:hypothetical protein